MGECLPPACEGDAGGNPFPGPKPAGGKWLPKRLPRPGLARMGPTPVLGPNPRAESTHVPGPVPGPNLRVPGPTHVPAPCPGPTPCPDPTHVPKSTHVPGHMPGRTPVPGPTDGSGQPPTPPPRKLILDTTTYI